MNIFQSGKSANPVNCLNQDLQDLRIIRIGAIP